MPRGIDEPFPKQRPITTYGDLIAFAEKVSNELYQPVMVIRRETKTKRMCVNCGGKHLTVTFRIVLQRTAVAILCDRCTYVLAGEKQLKMFYHHMQILEAKGIVTGRITSPSHKTFKVWISNERAGNEIKGGGPSNG